jgi:hypothetical protein
MVVYCTATTVVRLLLVAGCPNDEHMNYLRVFGLCKTSKITIHCLRAFARFQAFLCALPYEGVCNCLGCPHL